MIREAFGDDDPRRCRLLTIQLLSALSAAKSVDTLALGFSPPFMKYQAMWISAAHRPRILHLNPAGLLHWIEGWNLGGKVGTVSEAILIFLGSSSS